MSERQANIEAHLESSTTEGQLLESTIVESNEPTEITSLLKNKTNQNDNESKKEVHYRGIDGNRFWWLFGCIVFGNTIAFFDSTLMASSHPVITSYFQASNAASWLSTVFYLTSTVFQPLYGRISDTIGRRPVLLFANFMFFASTAWCALAGDIGSFIAARAVCGLGAGGVMSMCGIITSDIVKIEYRGIYQSYYNMAYGFGNGLGAAMGGFLCDRLGWRAAFGIQLPFIFVDAVLAYFVTPSDLGPNLAKSEGKSIFEAFKSFDGAGAAGLTVTVACLILGINLGGNVLTWTHPVVITSLVLFFVAAFVLVFVEQRATRPILPIRLLSNRPVGNLMWSNFLSAILTHTVIFNVPLFLQAVRQTTPTTAGFFLISPLIGLSISSVYAGFYITWTRRMKPMLVAGVLCLFFGIIAVTALTPTMPLWTALFLIPWCGVGQGFAFPATTIAVLALNSQSDQAVVTTTLGLLRNIGAVLGVAISSWILQNALIFYLDQTVTGTPQVKASIILKVRESIKAIATLDPKHKAQVISAYAQSLRVTFAAGIVFAIVVIALILPTSLPPLQTQSDMDTIIDDEQQEDVIDDSEEHTVRSNLASIRKHDRRASFDTMG